MGIRISQLTENTTLNALDLLYGVDVSDLTHSPDGTSKKIKLSTLISFLETNIDSLDIGSFDATAIVTEAEGIRDNDNDTTLPTSGAVVDAIDDSILYGSHRQLIINGGFDIWQRGTPRVTTSANRYTRYSADKWEAYRSAWGAGLTISRQVGDTSNGCTYSARVQRDSGNSSTATNFISNTLPNRDVTNCWNKYITLSFYARKGANYSSAESILKSLIITGTGSNQALSGGFTGQVDETQDNVLTTDWQRFTQTISAPIATTVNEIGIIFENIPVGTAGASDYFEVTGVQVNVGSVALPFCPMKWDDELARCQAYFEKSYSYDVSASTATELGCVHRVAYSAYWLYASDIQFKMKKILIPYVIPFNTYNGTAFQSTEHNTGDVRVADRTINTMDVGASSFSIIGVNSFGVGSLQRFHWVACAEDTA